MHRRIVSSLVLLAGAGLLLPVLSAESSAAPPVSDAAGAVAPRTVATRIHGELRTRLRTSARGMLWATGPRGDRAIQRDVAAAIRFEAPPTAERLAELAARGVRFSSTTPTLSGAYLAHVDEAGLDALEAASDVARVSPDAFVHAPRPSEESALGVIHAVDTIEAFRAKDGTELDGRGTVIGDLDSDVYVFHPAFFRADGGYHAFIDVDGDGVLTLDVDGVDLDEDGTVAPNEVLHRVKQGTLDYYTNKKEDWAEVAPNRDVLYLDANGNGKRDFGASFPESTPGYGEPMFVLDDADGDGVLRTTEKLARLGTSKIRGVFADKPYLRGDAKNPLSKYTVEGESGDELFEIAGHGTATTGVLVGGQGVGRPLQGVAPGAEVLVARTGRENILEGMQWLVDRGANVLLTEYAPWVAVSLDGSSELETFLDAARAKGILTVSPAGNLGGSNKHVTLSLKPGSNVVPVETDRIFASAHAIYFSFHYMGGNRKLTARVRAKGFEWATVPVDPNGVQLFDGIYGAATETVTPRGTHELHVYLAKQFGALPADGWEVDLVADDGAPLRVEGYVSDEVSGWRGGASFRDGSDALTICNPATADSAIRVGAFALIDVPSAGAKPGELLSYSSRGPLLRGGDGIDIGAPTDALAAVTPLASGAMGWMPFGGTSGAGPHVAGTLALMRQALPGASAEELRQKLLTGAKKDALVDKAGRTAFGQGRLDVAGALGIAPVTGTAPKLVAVVENDKTTKPVLRLDVTDDEPAETMRVRWDLDYDGVPDTEWEPLAPHAFEGKEPGLQWVRAEVLDRQGHVTSTTAQLEVGTVPPPSPDAEANADSGCGCHATPSRAPGWSFGAIALFALAFVRRRRS